MRVLLTALVLLAATDVDAKCLTSKCGVEWDDEVTAARASLRLECHCEGAPSPRVYKRCVRGELAGITRLPKACARAILACESRSLCGRPDHVVCCTRGSGFDDRVYGSIERSARACKGTVCSAFTHAADACAGDADSGCVEP